jgi:apolipoprotein N-acyltransferase
MITKKIVSPGTPVLFLLSAVFIILITSFSAFSPLLFVAFPTVFELIRGSKIIKQLIMLFSLIFIVCIVVFANAFFIQSHFFLFVLASLYFTALLGMDLFVSFCASKCHYALLIIFGYVILTRFILSLSTVVFPFYWTLTMHLWPFMGVISLFIMPFFWEALCISFSVMMYFIYSGRLTKHILVQMLAIVFIALGLSGIIKTVLGKSEFKPGLECTLIQGGYSRQDYVLVERYPALGRKIAQKYLSHLDEISNARFVVLPESAFPIHLIEESEIFQKLKETARLRNEYIMSGILLQENANVYNASVLINPNGQIQNIYRKRNTVLFVETSTFTKGIRAETFMVDGHIIAPIICYESIFLCDYFRNNEPDLYIVISNDIFGEKTILSRLHQAYGVINARTLGKPLLQAMQNGPSFYVDTRGNLINLTRPYEQAIGILVDIQ